MKTYFDCIACFVRQTVEAGRFAGLDDGKQEQLLRTVLKEVSGMHLTESPPMIAAKIHALIRGLCDGRDPYESVKARSNREALALYPELREEVAASEDPFETAVRFAMAGNIIDFGAAGDIPAETIRATFRKAREAKLPADHVCRLKEDAENAASILYIGDNAGEIVFDRLLVEQLPEGRVTYAVRGNPILNDVTVADAETVRMGEVAKILDSGAAIPGIILDECSKSFQEAFHAADLIIAKGQGNYESMSEIEGPITFLLMAKCGVLAEDIGCEVGSFVIRRK